MLFIIDVTLLNIFSKVFQIETTAGSTGTVHDLYVTRWEWIQLLVGANTDWQNWVTVLAVDGLEPGGAAGVGCGVAETVERHSEGFDLHYVPDGRDRAHHHQQHGHATDDILNHLLPNRHRQLLLGRRAQEKTAWEQQAQRCALECTNQRDEAVEERLCEWRLRCRGEWRVISDRLHNSRTHNCINYRSHLTPPALALITRI